MEGVVTMNARERERLCVVQAVDERRLTQKEAAQRLKVSARQVKRLLRAFRQSGAAGLVSRRRGRPSNRRIPVTERQQTLLRVRQSYADFGPTLAAEHLQREYGFNRSVETLRQWMIEDGLWKPRRKRHKRVFQLRERRPCVGELVQIDGSSHAWLEDRGPRCTLIAFVDDATGRLQHARFEPVETTRGYLRALRTYVHEHGRPVALYSDRHSIFSKHDPEDSVPTQFERAVRQLDIEPILAHTPQAKGRVERAFQTLQDRLVKELRLAGARTLKEANALLKSFMPQYNERFGKKPACAEDAHRPQQLDDEALRLLTCEQHERKLSKSLSCSYKGRQYLIETEGRRAYHLRGASVTVCDDGPDEEVVLLYQGKPLAYRRLERDEKPPRMADEKTLNDQVDQARIRQSKSRWKPAPDHPWRVYPKPAFRAPVQGA